MSFHHDIIDLTESFVLANHCATDFVIELDDESYIQSEPVYLEVNSSLESTFADHDGVIENTHTIQKERNKKEKKSNKNQPSNSTRKSNDEPSIKFGDCPICYEKLGRNPLASTKCGHVYCLKCLECCLKTEKKCPTCRRILKGSSAYHPLFLGN